MFRRRQAKTHGRLMREEFNESVQHFRMAAVHAVSGASDFIEPRVGAARQSVQPRLRRAGTTTVAMVVPFAVAIRGGARKAMRRAEHTTSATRRRTRRARTRAMLPTVMMMPTAKSLSMRKKRPTKRWSMVLGGLLAAGAAVGAGAIVARRRAGQSRWEEYGNPMITSGSETMVEPVKSETAGSMEAAGREPIQSPTESARERAAGMASGGSANQMGTASESSELKSRGSVYGKSGSGSNNPHV